MTTKTFLDRNAASTYQDELALTNSSGIAIMLKSNWQIIVTDDLAQVKELKKEDAEILGEINRSDFESDFGTGPPMSASARASAKVGGEANTLQRIEKGE